jgi:hypothetical protein
MEQAEVGSNKLRPGAGLQDFVERPSPRAAGRDQYEPLDRVIHARRVADTWTDLVGFPDCPQLLDRLR